MVIQSGYYNVSMRQWSLKAGDPLSLTLVSDARLVPGDYFDDQTWELSLNGGEPPALSLQTTYGLRAKAMRLFPRFVMRDITSVDPDSFFRAPAIHQIFPNFIELSFSPFQGIDVSIECWVPHPHAIGARMKITNCESTNRSILAEWVGQLSPTQGQRMTVLEMQGTTILYGYSGGLSPVVFMLGGSKPGPGPYPSLSNKMELMPSESRQITIIHAALPDRETSFSLARSIATQKWDAERTRLELLNSGQVEIYTGDPDWDAAFMLAQKNALSLIIKSEPEQFQIKNSTKFLSYPTFVLSRQPDQGFSSRGDGSDYDHLCDGQTSFDAYYLLDFLLPAYPDVAEGFIRNFLEVQEEDGFIDWKVGLGGQRSKLLATPLLASITWRIFKINNHTSFLEEVFPGLLKFMNCWFTPQHDRDGDGIPEWDHPLQAGLEDHPIYSQWHDCQVHRDFQGIDISTIESPALCAFLYNEFDSLVQIGKIINRAQEIDKLESNALKLKKVVEATWDEGASCYFNRDRDSHHTTKGLLILEGKGSGTCLVNRRFDNAIRPYINIFTEETVRRRPVIFLHGISASGNARIERITDDQIRWIPGLGKISSNHIYSFLSRVEIRGLEQEDRFSLFSVGYDFRDLSTLLPLWTGIPDSERARLLVEETIINPSRFWHNYGLPLSTDYFNIATTDTSPSVNLPWNSMIGKGLNKFGYQREAVELFTRLMQATIKSLKSERAFCQYYHADNAQGLGERNVLSGLTPMALFLETLGVELISPTRVGLSGINPYPWPVTIKFRGLTVLRQKTRSTVIFPDGQSVEIEDTSPQIVSLE